MHEVYILRKETVMPLPFLLPQLPSVASPSALYPTQQKPAFSNEDIAALLAQIGQAAAAGSGSPGMQALGNVANNVSQGRLQNKFAGQLKQDPMATAPALLAPDRAQATYDQLDKLLSMQKKAYDLARTPKQAEQADRLFEQAYRMAEENLRMGQSRSAADIADIQSQIQARTAGTEIAEGNLQLNQMKTMADVASAMADQELNPARKSQLESMANYYNAMAEEAKTGGRHSQSISPQLLFNISAASNASQSQKDLLSMGLQQNDTLFSTMTPAQQQATMQQFAGMLGIGGGTPQAVAPSTAVRPASVPATAKQLSSGNWGWIDADGTRYVFDVKTGETKSMRKP